MFEMSLVSVLNKNAAISKNGPFKASQTALDRGLAMRNASAPEGFEWVCAECGQIPWADYVENRSYDR